MASNPPFQVEDQTDEDFFDKLVDDDDDDDDANIVSLAAGPAPKPVESNDSDEASAFENLTVGNESCGDAEKVFKGYSDAVHSEDTTGECIGSFHPLSKDDSTDGKHYEDATSGGVGSFHAVGNNDNGDPAGLEGEAVVLNSHDDEGVRSEALLGSSVSNNEESASSGIKEVGWNSFYADSTENAVLGFGSYSDFFNVIADASNGKPEEDVKADELGQNAASYEQHTDGAQASETATGNFGNDQDTSSIEYWESLYPGWKYDATTGQWYQENNYNLNLQGSAEGSVGNLSGDSDKRAEVSYLQQDVHSVPGTSSAEENSSTQTVFGWEQAPQMNEYPEHMYFDPQYPGWYYDTIAQEWRTLETYYSSVQSSNQSIQAHDQDTRDQISSSGGYSSFKGSTFGGSGQSNSYSSEGFESKDNHSNWTGAYGDYDNKGSGMSQSRSFGEPKAGSGPLVNQQLGYLSSVSMQNHMHQQKSSSSSLQQVLLHDKKNHIHHNADAFVGFNGFIPSEDINLELQQAKLNQNDHVQVTSNLYSHGKPTDAVQSPFQNSEQVSFASQIGRSSDGRPPHALVTFGFGGKLVVMKDANAIQNPSFSGQALVGGTISVLNLLEVVIGNTNGSTLPGTHDYFRVLSQQYFPGPLVGGNVGNKELSKWIDDKITNLESPDADYRKGEVLRLLLSLLKIACQHYGKLRSPYGSENAVKENDCPESSVAQLFASAKKKGLYYGAISQCLQPFPSEAQIQATASEVQNLLVSGRKKEALQCARDGRLWGPALVLASQLGEQFYIDSVKQMALHQLVFGSPLRTLCLLIAGQPAEVFSMGTSDTGSICQQPVQVINDAIYRELAKMGANCMLDDWEENLAVITANRTKDDELVIIHLGDCLWRERSEIIPAHVCYLIADANFEAYSDSARLCLIGADHWKFPRTYASPEAIQRTELYEYSKVLGNSQFLLLPFQPYKLIYAHMLAEVGRMSDSLKYCQAVLRSLKTSRVPEVESWKQSISLLEERIRTHQQGGYAANLAPTKYFGKLLNFFDSTAHHLVGGLPPSAPSAHGDAVGSEHYQQTAGPRVLASQSTMAMSTLMPSASMEPISNWEADANKMKMHNRSVSEPDFGRTPRQVDSKTEASTTAQEKASGGGSRFTRFSFGSQLLQKTVGLVLRSRPDKQAKLGEKNKFYYDEKLKRWVEEGAEPPAEETALPPPPTSASFQDRKPDYNLKSASNSASSPNGGAAEFKLSSPPDHASGVPPIPTSSNQFSARGRLDVRARYVDTFNKGGGSQVNFFQSPVAKPITAANTKFFVPSPASTAEQSTGPNSGSLQENTASEIQSSSIIRETSEPHETYQSSPPSSSMTMQRFPSMGDIARGSSMSSNNQASAHARRASWSGGGMNNTLPPTAGERKSLGEALGRPPSSFMPHINSAGSLVDELHEVTL